MRTALRGCVLACGVLLVSTHACAINSVIVESKDRLAPNSYVEIRVKYTNDQNVSGLPTTLVLRADSVIAPATMTKPDSVGIGWRERLALPGGDLSEIVVIAIRGADAQNGTCKQGQPGGFFSPLRWTDSLTHPVEALPYCIFVTRNTILQPFMSPGADVDGSLLLKMRLNDQEGCFIIDTSCANPNNHLAYNVEFVSIVVPEFTLGYVCVGVDACQNRGFAAPTLVVPQDSLEGTSVVEFIWNKIVTVTGVGIIEPTGYTLEIDTSQSFSSPLVAKPTIGPDDTTAVLSLPQLNRNLHWRVRANGDDTQTPPECSSPNSVTRTIVYCDCPAQADFDGNGVLDAVDLNALIQVLYFNGVDLQDVRCPTTRGDYNADGLTDSVDLNSLIRHVFFNDLPPQDPCAP